MCQKNKIDFIVDERNNFEAKVPFSSKSKNLLISYRLTGKNNQHLVLKNIIFVKKMNQIILCL